MIKLVSFAKEYKGILFGGLSVIAIIIGFFAWLNAHDNAIRADALAEFNQQQQIKAEEERKRFMAQVRKLKKEQEDRLFEREMEVQEAEREARELSRELKKFEGFDAPASDVLKETIKRLQERAR